MNIYKKRQIVNKLMCALAFLCAIFTLVPLISIFGYVLSKGITSINLDFFINLPKPWESRAGVWVTL